MGTLIVGLVVLAAAALAVRSIYRTKKQPGGCGYGCSGCSGQGKQTGCNHSQ